MLKKYLLVATIFYSLSLVVVCLLPLKKVPDIGVSFGDKVFHMLSYIVLTCLWFYSFYVHFKIDRRKSLAYACVLSVVFGIIIEVLQEVLTNTRHADILDVLANSLGVLIAASIILLINRNTVKKL